MQNYDVRVRGNPIKGMEKTIENEDGEEEIVNMYEEIVYTDVYSGNAVDAVNSVVVQKKIKKEDIISVSTEMVY